MKRHAWILTVAILLLALPLAGCNSKGPDQNGPRTITDMAGRTVGISEQVDKVVALTASECEIIYALGAGDLLAGRGEFCDYPPEALNLPVLLSGQDTNLEQILALQPQVVLMSTMVQDDDQIAALEKAGIAVILTDAQDIEGVYSSIALIGEVVSKGQEAEKLVQSMKDRFQAVQEKAAAAPSGSTVFFEVSPLEVGLWTAGANTFMDEIASLCGLTNIFSDVGGWMEVSQEQVIERNPDLIITVTMFYGEGLPPEQEIMGRTAWQGITAVENKAVYLFDNDSFTRPGPRLVDAAEALGTLLYG